MAKRKSNHGEGCAGATGGRCTCGYAARRQAEGEVKALARASDDLPPDAGGQDWDTPCMVCGEKPTVIPTELCGPCCFGEAETFGGNW